MIRDTGISRKQEDDIDLLVQIEYQKFLQQKEEPMISPKNRKDRIFKQNKDNKQPQNSTNCDSVTFGRLKEMNKSQENYNKLLEMLGCRNYEEALLKVDRVNKADKFLQKVKQMMQKLAPHQQPNLHNSWRAIKRAVNALCQSKDE